MVSDMLQSSNFAGKNLVSDENSKWAIGLGVTDRYSAFGVASVIYLGFLLLSTYLFFWSARVDRRKTGWKTSVVYNTFCCWMFATGSSSMLLNIHAVSFKTVYANLDNAYTGFFISIVILLPYDFVLIFGAENFFGFIARRYEQDLDRLIEDNARLAYLLAVSGFSSTRRWIFRRNESPMNFIESKNYREIVAGSTAVDESGDRLVTSRVRVDMGEDTDTTWTPAPTARRISASSGRGGDGTRD